MKIRTAREATEVLKEAKEAWSRKIAWIWVQPKKYPKGVLSNSSGALNRSVDRSRRQDLLKGLRISVPGIVTGISSKLGIPILI